MHNMMKTKQVKILHGNIIEGRAGIRALLTIEFYCRYALIPARPPIIN